MSEPPLTPEVPWVDRLMPTARTSPTTLIGPEWPSLEHEIERDPETDAV